MEQPHSSSSSLSFYYSGSEEIHKPAARPVKKAVAPPPPKLPRVYKVDPINFRDVVQKLTAAPEFQDRRLQSMPAPHPNLSNPPPHSSGQGSVSYNGYLGEFSKRY